MRSTLALLRRSREHAVGKEGLLVSGTNQKAVQKLHHTGGPSASSPPRDDASGATEQENTKVVLDNGHKKEQSGTRVFFV
eukprot:2477074-Pyramimonas_sp.AAC.2